MTFGEVPFGSNEENPFRIYECILASALSFPSLPGISKGFKDFIELLLNKNSAQRKYKNIDNNTAHPWLEQIQWDMLIGREISAPYIPDLKDSDNDTILLLDGSCELKTRISSRVIEENEDNNEDLGEIDESNFIDF